MKTLLPVPRPEDAEFVFDPHGVVRELIEYVDLVAQGPSGAGIIIGNYGFGKTHLMLHLAGMVKRRFSNSVVVYVNTPGSSILNIYRAFMTTALDNGLLNGVANTLGQPLRELIQLLSGDDEEARYARYWLLGDPVPQSFRVEHGLPASRVNDELAVRFMVEVGNALVLSGRGPVLVMLDELEDIVTLGQSRRLQYLSQLRIFVDNLPSKSFFLASSTPAGWDEVVNTYPALARRLSSFTVYLRPFSQEETGEFINEVIKWRGLPITVDEGLVKVIYEFTEGNPGEVVKALNLALTVFNAEGRVDIGRVKEVLSRHV